MSNDDEPLIPCEFCDNLIGFAEYESHVRQCAIRTTLSQSQFLLYRDDDDRQVYRINIAPAIEAFQNMYMAQNEDEAIGSNIPQTNIRSLIVLPHIIPTIPELTDGYAINMLISDILGRVPVGLPDADSALEPNDGPAQDVCPICQDNIDVTHHVKTLCKHSYCKPCIIEWFKEHVTCPLCNTDQRDIKKIEKDSEMEEGT